MTSRAQQRVDRALAGDRRSLARAITLVEMRSPGVGTALATTTVRRRAGPGAPHVVGITGPPGAGKSTLADRIIEAAVAAQQRVAVVAVDPSSPFSGGAILGDRVRMGRHTGNDLVFIRSLSSRGHLGGLSAASAEVVDLLDAAGFDLVLVETVGVGQSELGVMEVADTVVVVLTPESGDAVQTMKAGLLEIADVFAVNKADRPGADRLVRDLQRSIELNQAKGWQPPVHATSAAEGRGVEALLDETRKHLAWCAGEGLETWRTRRGDALIRLYLDLVGEAARAEARTTLDAGLEEAIRTHRITPHQAALGKR
ncbi:MAG: methylmalonyl Co-A mutase-associated GTPase MeaB [Deltaproteobacteria bacterium]|nr:methylmalonyl Co-A mutase-associated GTPase MeaB [Deltaproteobacteria bacterium]